MHACCAQAPTVTGASSCCAAQSRTAANWSPSSIGTAASMNCACPPLRCAGTAEPLQPMLHLDLETARGTQQTGTGGGDSEREAREPVTGAVEPEDLAHHAELERCNRLGDDRHHIPDHAIPQTQWQTLPEHC